MLANARVLGYVFNPLTVFWCHDPEGDLRCVVAEVHNTHGERHCYLLHPGERGRCETDKQFYVSPFLTVDGRYRMSFSEPGEPLARADGPDPGRRTDIPGIAHRPAVTSDRPPADATAVRHPLMTLRVTALIHLQGVKLWARGVRRVRRPRHDPQEGVG